MMSKDRFEHFGNEEHRGTFVERELSRLKTSPPPEPPEVTARKAQVARERLARHDRMFGVYPGVTLGAEPPWEAGDPEGDADVG